MPLSTYAELRASVADWLHRGTSMDAQIPDFIRLAELEINRRLRIVAQEVETPMTCIPGSRFVPQPAGFGTALAMWSDEWNPRHELTMVTAVALPVDDGLSTLPRYWAVDGANIAFNCKADQAYTLRLRYLQNLFLSDAAPTHALFARAPDLYLFGALAMSAPYTMEDQQLPVWQARFESLLRSVAAEGARPINDAALRTEIPGVLTCGTRSRFNIWG